MKRVEQQGGGGLLSAFKSIWGDGGGQKPNDNLVAKFEEERKNLSPEERKELDEAIGYQENQQSSSYPKEVSLFFVTVWERNFSFLFSSSKTRRCSIWNGCRLWWRTIYRRSKPSVIVVAFE